MNDMREDMLQSRQAAREQDSQRLALTLGLIDVQRRRVTRHLLMGPCSATCLCRDRL